MRDVAVLDADCLLSASEGLDLENSGHEQHCLLFQVPFTSVSVGVALGFFFSIRIKEC